MRRLHGLRSMRRQTRTRDFSPHHVGKRKACCIVLLVYNSPTMSTWLTKPVKMEIDNANTAKVLSHLLTFMPIRTGSLIIITTKNNWIESHSELPVYKAHR